MKKYEPIEGSNKQLKMEVYYDKGGMNYFNSKVEPRGYWLSMRQVERDTRENGVVMESYGMFSGAKAFLLEVKKKSEKSYERALVLAEDKIPELKSHVLAEKNS
jgi:hypothetical protein